MKRLIINCKLVNEGEVFHGALLCEGSYISKVFRQGEALPNGSDISVFDAGGLHLIPGVIDDQVHFRDPGFPDKGDIASESRAAVAGGTTSFMDMPNTDPQTLTRELLEDKYRHAATCSPANYSFYMGVSNDNIEEVLKTDPSSVCGIKIFMGASTGNMLVDDHGTLEDLFSKCGMLIAVHCEDEDSIRSGITRAKAQFGESVPISEHPKIRNAEACYRSSSFAISLAKKHNTRLHILHLSTAGETALFRNDIPLEEKRITAEVCIHHLWFSDDDYINKGWRIKWNPAIKSATDRKALLEALLDNRIDIIATDHAPHEITAKQQTYFKCPSGGPMVQHALPAMLTLAKRNGFGIERVVEKMCHAPARCFGVTKRGFLRAGYYADLVLVDMDTTVTASDSKCLYKCGWTPLDGEQLEAVVRHTFVNGRHIYNDGAFNDSTKGMRLMFER